jgi:GNAT superfamily N-acetyltransferase
LIEAARRAVAAEAGRLAELARAAVAELAPTRGGSVWKEREAQREPLEERFAEAIADPDTLVLVGTIDETPVGYSVVVCEPLHNGAVLGVVRHIFVEEEARGVGVGEAMMEEALVWCRARGCVGVDAMALPGHRATKNFFEDSGFSARLLVMHRDLSAESQTP